MGKIVSSCYPNQEFEEPQPVRVSRRLAEKKEQRQLVNWVDNSPILKKRRRPVKTSKNVVVKGHPSPLNPIIEVDEGHIADDGLAMDQNESKTDDAPADLSNGDSASTSTTASSSNGVKTGLVCPLAGCFRTFKNHNWLLNHKEIHEGLKPFVCEVCAFGYADEIKLMEHFIMQHTKESLFECIECKKSYKSKRFLDGHVEKCHTK